jgi:hypothetical protein
MDLSVLPQFTVEEIRLTTKAGETSVIGRLSHLRGVRNERGFLYRSRGPSIVRDLAVIPTSPGEDVEFITPDAALAPELQVGVSFPWLDGYWQPYHLTMIMAPTSRWERRPFLATPARYFRLDGVTGWQPAEAPLPDGALDLGLRAGGWDHEHCELCRARIGMAGALEGYVDPDEYWLCDDCFERYAKCHDVSFAAEA